MTALRICNRKHVSCGVERGMSAARLKLKPKGCNSTDYKPPSAWISLQFCFPSCNIIMSFCLLVLRRHDGYHLFCKVPVCLRGCVLATNRGARVRDNGGQT